VRTCVWALSLEQLPSPRATKLLRMRCVFGSNNSERGDGESIST
jgi:hypothetical protein